MTVTEGPGAADSRRRPLLQSTAIRWTAVGGILSVWATVAMKAFFAASVLTASHATLVRVWLTVKEMVSGAAAVGKLVEGATDGTRELGTAEEYVDGFIDGALVGDGDGLVLLDA